ncbi:hypothetical protein JT358_12100 [Micrococcales bacterium 31B]|nr:hypothetical protein [Micrococcales bacterium 31B]
MNRCHGTTTYKYNDGKLTGTSVSPNAASGQKAASGIRATNTASLEGKYYYRVC